MSGDFGPLARLIDLISIMRKWHMTINTLQGDMISSGIGRGVAGFFLMMRL
jgi:hypothetical protein